MPRELNVVEQRYRAVLEALGGIAVIEIAERYGWLARRSTGGLPVTRAEGIAAFWCFVTQSTRAVTRVSTL
jgi:hypothetical protein